MRKKEKNAFVFIFDDILTLFDQKLGVFGPVTFTLVAGLLFGVGSLFLFSKLTEDLLFNELLLFDSIVTSIVRYFSSEQMTVVMKQISQLGYIYVIVITAVLSMAYTGLIRKRYWDTLLVPVSLVGGIILNQGLKFLFHRQRPGLTHLEAVSGFSFPSGHSMMSFVFYGLLIYLCWINFRSLAARVLATFVFTLVIVAVGISRIYLGVHFPSDVVAGFSAGSFWLISCIIVLRGIRYRNNKDGKVR